MGGGGIENGLVTDMLFLEVLVLFTLAKTRLPVYFVLFMTLLSIYVSLFQEIRQIPRILLHHSDQSSHYILCILIYSTMTRMSNQNNISP